MKIALISDNLTRDSLEAEDNTSIVNINKYNYKIVFKFWKPDFLFIESAWEGKNNSWKFGVASYPGHPERNNNLLKKVIKYAKSLNIPTVFWNKEDGVHFDRFIDSAKLCDYIFTVDINSVPRYKAIVDSNVIVDTLIFAVQAKFHNFTGFHFKSNEVDFVGSYSRHTHDARREWQDLFFSSAAEYSHLVVFDRNSHKTAKEYQYPDLKNITMKSSVKYEDTAQVYKDYLISLNVNTIIDSKTMFSRRLVEIIACGGIAVTNPSPAVDNYFKDYCWVINNKEEMDALLFRLKNGPLQSDKIKMEKGAKYIADNHTWTHRLNQIKEKLKI